MRIYKPPNFTPLLLAPLSSFILIFAEPAFLCAPPLQALGAQPVLHVEAQPLVPAWVPRRHDKRRAEEPPLELRLAVQRPSRRQRWTARTARQQEREGFYFVAAVPQAGAVALVLRSEAADLRDLSCNARSLTPLGYNL